MKGNCFWVHSLYYFFFINFYEIFLYRSHVPKFLSSKFYLIFVRTTSTILHILLPLAPNGPEKRGCRTRIRDSFIKIRDLFSTTRL